jgi:hypothetical protein
MSVAATRLMNTQKTGSMAVKRIGEITIYAIDDRNLVDILKKVGIYQDVAAGRTRCHFCGVAVTMQNLGGLFKHEGQVRVVCNDIKCLYEAAWFTARRRTA